TLIDETQERNDEEMLFDVQDDLQGEEVVAEKEVAEKEVVEKEVSVVDPVTTISEVVTTANVEVTTASAPTTDIDELTLAQTLTKIKAAKPKAVTTAAITTTTTRLKARGVAKDKGKAIMVEPEKPLKKKDQIALDEEVARYLKAQLQAELEEEEERLKLFDKEMTRVNMFINMDTKMKEGSNKAKTDTTQESSSKRAGDELEQEKSKKQKGDDDQEEEEMKKHMDIV
ncbi:hypothetical protein Tco_0716280, partial [Tanacetum coccineum]